MADIPPPDQQKENIKKIEEGSLKIGEKVCPIEAEWYNKWKFYVGYDEGSEPTPAKLDPIDNNKILSSSQDRLKDTVSEEHDYFILRKDSYDLLQKWYTGGPTIIMDVISDNKGKPTIIKKYITIEANFKDDKKKVEIHRFMKISDVHQLIRSEFKVPDTLKTCLHEFLNHIVGKLLDEDSYVEDCSIIFGEQILLDYFEDDKWYSSSLKAQFKKNEVISNRTSSSLSQTRGEAGIVGFNNLGNTCFFNSGTQCLMHTVPLMNFMLEDKWEGDLNLKNPLGMKGELAKTFASLAKKVWSGEHSTISPRELKHVIGRYAPQFSGWGQQDSHELILFTLDGVHEDLNRCKTKPYIESVEGDGTDDEEKAKEAWKRHKLRNDSIIVDLFHGQIRSRLICPKCNSTTVVFDPYMSIPMPINRPHTKKISVVYVPFDFFEQRKTLKIELPSASKDINESASESISKLIGKQVKVALGVRSYIESPIKWGLQDSYYSTATTFAYEVPDTENALYIPCSIKMKSKRGYYSTQSITQLQTPFLVDIHDLPDNFDDAEEISKFEEKIVDRINKLWDPNYQVEETENSKKLIEDLDPTPKEGLFSNESEKINVTAKSNKTSYYYSYSQSNKNNLKTPSKSCKYFVDAQATIVLNPDSKFSFPALLQNIEPKAENDEEARKKSDSITLDACFEFFSTEEVLDEDNKWYCPKCKDFVCAKKKLNIWKVPQILVIQLKRFIGGSRWSSKKLDQYVDFPEVIDMKKYVVGPQSKKESLNYRLYAVSNHMGGLGGGHYTACAKVRDPINQNNDKGWYYFNDSSASHSSESNAHSSSAYVLFYERI